VGGKVVRFLRRYPFRRFEPFRRGRQLAVTSGCLALVRFYRSTESWPGVISEGIGFLAPPLTLPSRVASGVFVSPDARRLGGGSERPLLILVPLQSAATAPPLPGPCGVPCAGSLPYGFFPFNVFPIQGRRFIGPASTPDPDPLPAFHTPSGVCSAPNLPALFHAGPVHGVFPPGSISTRRAVHPFGCRCPLAVDPRWPRAPLGTTCSDLHFKALFPASVRTYHPAVQT
jgi:hypothetical protein